MVPDTFTSINFSVSMRTTCNTLPAPSMRPLDHSAARSSQSACKLRQSAAAC